MRGNQVQVLVSAVSIGSIPACAGEPRRCKYHRKLYNGLSPRVRGNPSPAGAARRSSGSIPACAGEPGIRAALVKYIGVYPRVCGGTIDGIARRANVCGLSPRVRGNQVRIPTAPRYPRSIPACAGEPFTTRIRSPMVKVYPRVCGGTRYGIDAATAAAGLSPRVRGNLALASGLSGSTGSIPACAGEPGPLTFWTFC